MPTRVTPFYINVIIVDNLFEMTSFTFWGFGWATSYTHISFGSIYPVRFNIVGEKCRKYDIPFCNIVLNFWSSIDTQ